MKCSALMVDQFGIAADVIGDYGQTAAMASRITLDKLSESEVRTATSRKRGRRECPAIAEEDRAGAEAKTRRFPLQFRRSGPSPARRNSARRHALMDLRGDAQKSRMILVTVIHPRDHADTERAGALGQAAGARLKASAGKAFPMTASLSREQACSDKAIGGGLRIADHGVAPAKSGGLSAELRGRHQVSELAMAADNDGHAGKFGCGNQREVGIEIEGVRDLNMTAVAQVAAQAEASAQRLPSEQAAAEGKLRSVSETVGERAAAVDAA